MKKLLIFLFVTMLIAAGCTSSQASNQTDTMSERCQPASTRQIDNIRSGVKDIAASNDIASTWAVKSGDYENVWFVAAQITGPGINLGDATGLWAISGDQNNSGLTYSVNSFANEFSSWGDGTKTTAQLSQFDDGAQEALECARSNP